MIAERACAWCGADISHRGPRAAFCGNLCKKRKYNAAKRYYIVKNCIMCSAAFDASGRQHRRIVCSDDCWRAWDRLKHARNSQTPKTICGPHIPMACKWCGGPHINFNGRRGYCSKFCKSKAYASSQTGIAYRRFFAATGYDREYKRRQAAKASLATLLLPIHKAPEVN